uniref:Uncharacterized protein n=1 Tax=Arundo donax TaxID=35708 RepID=A0A0A9AE34_ARUDO
MACYLVTPLPGLVVPRA